VEGGKRHPLAGLPTQGRTEKFKEAQRKFIITKKEKKKKDPLHFKKKKREIQEKAVTTPT